jgi:hypothetical protein
LCEGSNFVILIGKLQFEMNETIGTKGAKMGEGEHETLRFYCTVIDK